MHRSTQDVAARSLALDIAGLVAANAENIRPRNHEARSICHRRRERFVVDHHRPRHTRPRWDAVVHFKANEVMHGLPLFCGLPGSFM